MTATDLDLLRAVLEAPGEDAPRIAYADWLDEHAASVSCPACGGGKWTHHRCRRCGVVYRHVHKYSDCGSVGCEGEECEQAPCPACSGTGSVSDRNAERAEFVRVQIELAEREANDWDPVFWKMADDFHRVHEGTQCQCRRCALRRRERELFSWLCVRLDADLPASLVSCVPDWDLGNDTPRATFRRGFVESLTCDAVTWLEVADQIAWRPEWKCRACGGSGDVEPKPPKSGFGGACGVVAQTCPNCRGSGERTCPEGAQPVRLVTWTTVPSDDVMIQHGAAVLARPGQTSLWTFRSWPGVEFTLPG